MSPLALPLVAAIPLLFLHVAYQPGVAVDLGSTEVEIVLSDLAVLAVAIAALAAGVRDGFGRLRGGRWIWVAAAAFLALVFASTLHPLASDRDYPFAEHFVTALKYAEYAVLAPAVPLLLRRPADLAALWAVVVATSAAATGWALLQFAGLVTAFGLEPEFQRVPSFVGFEDFALLSAASVTLALGQPGWRLGPLALVAGGLGLVLSGALAGVLALVLAATAILAVALVRGMVAPRRALALAGLVGIVAAGTLVMRSGDVTELFRFARTETTEQKSFEGVESYAQRAVLGYVGWRIFLDHPALGVGWQGSLDEDGYGPQLAEAHERFPSEPDRAFPSPYHPWGVHNMYIQAMSDMGVPGLVLLAALLGATLWLALRAARRAPPAWTAAALVAVGWTLLVAGLANATGLVAGIPLDAALWLSAGLAALVSEVGRAAA